MCPGRWGKAEADDAAVIMAATGEAKALERLEEDGYVVIAGALDLAVVDRLRAAFDRSPSGTGTEHVEVGVSTAHGEVWASLARHHAVADPIATLIGPSVIDVHGRNPRPGYGQQGLHADAPPRGRHDPIAAVTAIWMLDPFTAANGATRVVPGTHVRRDAVPRPMAQPDAHHPDEVIVTGEPGDVLLFNGHLWHSGTRNRSTRSRRAVQMTARRM